MTLNVQNAAFPFRGKLVLRILSLLGAPARERFLFGSSRACLPLQKLAQRLLRGPRIVQGEFSEGILRGRRFECWTSEKYFFLGGDFERGIQKLVSETVTPGDIVYDIGAHCGFWTLLLSSLCGPRGHVFAFEPSPLNFARLRRNLGSNGDGQITAVNFAVSDDEGTLLLSERSSSSEIVSEAAASNGECSRVGSVRLDDFIYRDHHPAPAFIKIDVEGHAGRCLEGMKETLRNARPSVLCEIHHLEEQQAVAKVLVGCSYDVLPLESSEAFPRHILATPIGSSSDLGGANGQAGGAQHRLPTVSVIIPTKNRPLDLERTVESLLRQAVAPRQLVIIDQSSNEESRRRVENLCAGAPSRVGEAMKLDYIRDVDISGVTAARNRAMQVADGEVWLFLDDDVDLEPNFVEELLSAYLRQPEVSGVSGVVTNYRPPSGAFRSWSRVFIHGPFHDERQPIYWNADRLLRAEPIRVTKFGGGLMSFRADAVRGLQFDESLRGAPDGEDVDFCSQLGSHAILVIAPRARLVHKQSQEGRATDHWLQRHARATHYLYRRNWDRGLRNRFCFAWLNVGYALAATAASLRRRSLEPWRALLAGACGSQRTRN